MATLTLFDFIAIGTNLLCPPPLVGNICLWKPAVSPTYASWVVYRILRKASLPVGAVQFLPGSGKKFVDTIPVSEHMAGIHSTGSTAFFEERLRRRNRQDERAISRLPAPC